MEKASLASFLAYLNEQVANMSIYVWGAQGQKWPTLCEAWIQKKETSAVNRTTALATYKRAVTAGHKENCRAFDCSGLGMYYIQNLTRLSKGDMTANGMKGKCELITKAQLRKGDWVFRIYKTGKKKGQAYHIGYVVDSSLSVIEARGRAYGVVKRTFDSSYWNAYGRPSYFKTEIEQDPAPKPEYIFTRLLKKGLRGKDVKQLQQLLNVASAANLAEDGIFGPKTLKAVRAFQKARGLKVDGLAGRRTLTALGGRWIA